MNQYPGNLYDSRGNTTDDGTFTYTYDAKDRLVGVEALDHSVKQVFQYDPQDRRVEKADYAWSGSAWQATPTKVTRYAYDGDELIAEFDATDGTNHLLKSYAWGQGGPAGGLLSVTDYSSGTPQTYLPVYDGSGNVVSLTDSTGTLAASFRYDPWGNRTGADGTAADVLPLLWGGGYRDLETGLIYLRHRFYSPGQGRFLTRDPIAEAADVNLYRYGGNDPINSDDPSGLKKKKESRTNTEKWLQRFERKVNANPWNLINPTQEANLPWLIIRGLAYDMWAESANGVSKAYGEMRVQTAEQFQHAPDRTTRYVNGGLWVASWPMEGTSDGALIFSEGAAFAPVAGPVAGMKYVKPVVPYVVGGLTTLKTVDVGSRLMSPEGRDTLTLMDWMQMGTGWAGTWHASGGARGPLNPLNYRLAVGGEVTEGSVTLGMNRLIRRVNPAPTGGSIQFQVVRRPSMILAVEVAPNGTPVSIWGQAEASSSLTDGHPEAIRLKVAEMVKYAEKGTFLIRK